MPPSHFCQVFGSPWEGVYSTHIASTRHYGKHWHAVYGLGLLDDGAQSSASGRGMVDAYAGDIITTNPGEVHDGKPLGGPSRRWRMVYLEPGVLQSMAGEPAAPALRDVVLARPVLQDTALRQALRYLLDHIEHWRSSPGTAVESLACEEALVHTCALLLQRHADAPRMRTVDADIRQVHERLADDPLEPPTLSQMAAMAGLSKYQLLRRFAQAYGLPPHAWLLQQRAERGRHLIRQGNSLAEAAAACGFADQSHMTRIFARQFGFTPGAWQKAMAGRALQ